MDAEGGGNAYADWYGYYEIGPIPVGTYTVVAYATGYIEQSFPGVVVEKATTTPLDFYLEPKLVVFSDYSSIMTGGIANEVHRCTITAYAAEELAGQSVTFSIVPGGQEGGWEGVAASLSATVVPLNEYNEASTVLTSSNLVGSVTVMAQCQDAQPTVTITQSNWDAEYCFGLYPEEWYPDGETLIDVYFGIGENGTGCAVPGHTVHFDIYEICDGEYPVDPQYWDDYVTLLSDTAVTDECGYAQVQLQAGYVPGVVCIAVEDLNVWVP